MSPPEQILVSEGEATHWRLCGFIVREDDRHVARFLAAKREEERLFKADCDEQLLRLKLAFEVIVEGSLVEATRAFHIDVAPALGWTKALSHAKRETAQSKKLLSLLDHPASVMHDVELREAVRRRVTDADRIERSLQTAEKQARSGSESERPGALTILIGWRLPLIFDCIYGAADTAARYRFIAASCVAAGAWGMHGCRHRSGRSKTSMRPTGARSIRGIRLSSPNTTMHAVRF
jgi:hypothetical protein